MSAVDTVAAILGAMTADEAITSLRTMAGVNWSAALQAAEAGKLSGDIQLAEDVVEVIAPEIAPFVPGLSQGLAVAKLVVAGVEIAEVAEEDGLWRPGEPTDPALEHADGGHEGR